MAGLIEDGRSQSSELANRAAEVLRELKATEARIERLYEALADGMVNDTDLFRDKLRKLEQDRDEQQRLIASFNKRIEVPARMLSEANLRRFEALARERLRAEDGSFRKAYLDLLTDRVEVGDREIRFCGSKAALANAVMAASGGVPRFVPEWWAG